MSRAQRHDIACPLTVSTGAPLNVEDFSSGAVQVFGISGGATLRIEGTIDGTNYLPVVLSNTVGSPTISADGMYKLGLVDVESTFAYAKLQASRLVVGTGSPPITVTFSGRNARAS